MKMKDPAGHRKFTTIEKDDVLTLEHVERFSRVVMSVEGRPEIGRLVGFEKRESAFCFLLRCLDRHLESAKVD
jgi:hypothetical protein